MHTTIVHTELIFTQFTDEKKLLYILEGVHSICPIFQRMTRTVMSDIQETCFVSGDLRGSMDPVDSARLARMLPQPHSPWLTDNTFFGQRATSHKYGGV